MPSAHAAVEYGDRCWSKVLLGWREWRDRGLTEHRNWWPGAYQQYCKQKDSPPNTDALAFNTTYETVRADLKDLSASA